MLTKNHQHRWGFPELQYCPVRKITYDAWARGLASDVAKHLWNISNFQVDLAADEIHNLFNKEIYDWFGVGTDSYTNMSRIIDENDGDFEFVLNPPFNNNFAAAQTDNEPTLTLWAEKLAQCMNEKKRDKICKGWFILPAIDSHTSAELTQLLDFRRVMTTLMPFATKIIRFSSVKFLRAEIETGKVVSRPERKAYATPILAVLLDNQSYYAGVSSAEIACTTAPSIATAAQEHNTRRV
eukprot:TRINITY_DN7943_c1_g1_i2.p2 TRINITY_DN7943_c1_g1~~TRINITY_DN7943_c1_g1_i2.p2  ORF type:complete len:239 (+),score=30.49 TRINITY_DN7943_c1_g1_i2:168-884(+)